MVRAEVAGQKIARAEAWLREVEDLLAVSAEQLATDGRRADLASFYLFLAIQEAIDLAAHWLADAGWPPADDVGSTFDTLAAKAAISVEIAGDALDRAREKPNRTRVHDRGSPAHPGEAPAGIATLRSFLSAVAVASAPAR